MRLVTPLSISATVNSSLILEFSKDVCVYPSAAGFDFLETFNLSSVILQQPAPSANPRALRGPRNVPKTARAGKGKRGTRGRSRILVVDDVADVTEMISLFLKHAGYQVSTADSAQAALRLARAQAFDMVISDIGMPQMNGYELVGELRGLQKYKDIPMIAVTGYSEYDDRGRAVRAGFNIHLTKPIDPAGLLKLITEMLGSV